MSHQVGKFDHDLTVRPNPGIMANKGNHPLLWPNNSGQWIIVIYPEQSSLLATLRLPVLQQLTMKWRRWDPQFSTNHFPKPKPTKHKVIGISCMLHQSARAGVASLYEWSSKLLGFRCHCSRSFKWHFLHIFHPSSHICPITKCWKMTTSSYTTRGKPCHQVASRTPGDRKRCWDVDKAVAVEDSHFVQLWKLRSSRHRLLHDFARRVSRLCPTDRGFFMFFHVWTPHFFFLKQACTWVHSPPRRSDSTNCANSLRQFPAFFWVL